MITRSIQAARWFATEPGICTHGPDPAPPGVDPATMTAPLFQTSTFAQSAVCDGDGQSGDRVQVLYVYGEGDDDNYSDYVASIRTWAAEADEIYRESALQTGGQRYLRFVHDSSCVITVTKVEVSQESIDPDGVFNLYYELADLGYGRNDRKYLIFQDVSDLRYCGQGLTFTDDSPSQNNLNNTMSSLAAVYNGCWDDTTTAAHELGHALGAVQESAPNATAYGHCDDEWDVMCYADGPGSVMTVVCTNASNEYRLDCNHDDYFHTDPPNGNYLSDHWNVADSSFWGRVPHQFRSTRHRASTTAK